MPGATACSSPARTGRNYSRFGCAKPGKRHPPIADASIRGPLKSRPTGLSELLQDTPVCTYRQCLYMWYKCHTKYGTARRPSVLPDFTDISSATNAQPIVGIAQTKTE